MTIYLVQDGAEVRRLDEVEDRLKPSIPGLRRIPKVDDIGVVSLNGAERAFAIVLATASENGDCETIIDIVARQPRHVFFIVVGGEISARAYKRLIQSGNAEWVAESAAPHEILDIVGRIDAAASDAGRTEPPVVVSFVPSAGGVGNSTLAIETAIQLVGGKAAKNARVALLDLDFQSSHVCDYLDIPPKLQFEEMTADPERLDDQLMSVFISRHSSGLDVFAAERSRFSRRDLDVEALSALLDRMAHRYSHIVVDLPVSVHPWTVPLLAASTAVLATGLNTIPGLRQIAETQRALREDCGVSGELRAVVNRCDFGMLGSLARADHVARVLGEEKRFHVRNARIALECVNVGTPMSLAYPSDRAVKDIAAIANHCAGLKPAAPKLR